MKTPELPTLKERLQWARKRGDYTQKEVATRSGLSPTVYFKLERGDNKTTGRIVQIAQALGVNPTWLATGSGDPLVTSSQIAKIPIDNDSHLLDNPSPPLKKWAEVIAQKGEEMGVFCYKMDGDSMQGGKPQDIPHGATLDIDPGQRGAIGLVHLADIAGYPAVGVLQAAGPKLWLKPTNQDYPALEIDGGCLIGAVVGYRVTLPR